MSERKEIYYPTYALRPDLSEGDAAWLETNQGQGPLDISDVTDVCATFGVSASLYDVGGFFLGHVDDAGTPREVRTMVTS